jgi:enoyl-CoA hydratase/carnithine racemase
MSEPEEILLSREDGLAILTINRPRALNALTLDNYRRIDPALREWAADPSVRAVLVRGAGGRAFCAGGDVRAVYEAGRGISGPPDLPAVFFSEEYELIRHIHHFPKPYIAIISGITMGAAPAYRSTAPIALPPSELSLRCRRPPSVSSPMSGRRAFSTAAPAISDAISG